MIDCKCPHCGERLQVADKRLGYAEECPRCQRAFEVQPAPTAPPASPVCPACKMAVPAGATRCGHCTSWIGKPPVDRQPINTLARIIMFVVGLMIVLGLLRVAVILILGD